MSVVISLFALLPFYLLGAFPTGRLVARAYGIDITSQGSGNVGATNVARVVGKRAGLITLGGDVVKGALGIVLAQYLFGHGWLTASAGIALVSGHCFSLPPWLKGGKGVATALGVLFGLYPLSAVVAIFVFLGIFTISKIVSLASIAAALAVPIVSMLVNAPDYISIAQAVIAALVVYRHRENITRLIEGREPRFKAKSAAGDSVGESRLER